MDAAEQPSGLPVPEPYATHDTWAKYAVSRGMDPGQARGLTRDQLRVRLTDPPPAPDPDADHNTWVGYAVSRGMPGPEAQRMTRDQLRMSVGTSLVGGAPQLARHDQEPQ